MRKIFSLDEAKDQRWRRHCLAGLSKRWRMPPEQIVDALLLEAYLQVIVDGARPRPGTEKGETLFPHAETGDEDG